MRGRMLPSIVLKLTPVTSPPCGLPPKQLTLLSGTLKPDFRRFSELLTNFQRRLRGRASYSVLLNN